MQITEIYTRADPSVKLEALESVVPPKVRSGVVPAMRQPVKHSLPSMEDPLSKGGRIDPSWVTSEGWSGLTSQSNWIDFSKAPYASCPPGCTTVICCYARNGYFRRQRLGRQWRERLHQSNCSLLRWRRFWAAESDASKSGYSSDQGYNPGHRIYIRAHSYHYGFHWHRCHRDRNLDPGRPDHASGRERRYSRVRRLLLRLVPLRVRRK